MKCRVFFCKYETHEHNLQSSKETVKQQEVEEDDSSTDTKVL